jgi:hypothetical protein
MSKSFYITNDNEKLVKRLETANGSFWEIASFAIAIIIIAFL